MPALQREVTPPPVRDVTPVPAVSARPPTVDLELEPDEEYELKVDELRADEFKVEEFTSTTAEAMALPRQPTLDPQARAVIATCESELETKPQALRAARLHYEIARAYESAGFGDQASNHYAQALEGAPEYVPAIRGARRAAIERTDLDTALKLFDAEEKLTASPERKAMLVYQKGRLVEDAIGDAVRARELYVKALELDGSNASLLKALEQCDRTSRSSETLLATTERVANGVSHDARYRAALLVGRAQLLEKQDANASAAAELYEAALRLDRNVIGAVESLERIYRRDQQWRNLSAALDRTARQTTDEPRRAVALLELANIHGERLGNRAEAVAALVKAADAAPADILVLEDLARGHELVDDFESLAEVLASLAELARDKRDRIALLHRLGQVHEVHLGQAEHAIARYREALLLDATYLPVLQALGRLLATRKQWGDLVEMHLAEAAATQTGPRAAAAHARVAELFEVHLRDPVEAVNHHARALTLAPNHAASFKALTRLYAQLDRHRELVELLERAVAHAEMRALKIAYLMKIGSIWEDSLADPVQALHAFRRILELDPLDLVAIHAIQRVAERAERFPQLVEALEREVELVDDRALQTSLLHRIGTVLDEHVGDHDGALARFRRALELDPAFVPALASVGRIYYRTGRWADLLDTYERETRVASGSEAVALLCKMGELSEEKLGDVDAAISWYRRALEIDPTYRPAIRTLVRRLHARKDWQGLAATLELEVAAIEQPSARATAWYRIGHVREEWLGDVAGAITAYKQAAEHAPDYRPPRVALARLHAERGEWPQVVELLSREAGATADTLYATSLLMRQGEIYRDEIRDQGQAVLCFEGVRDTDGGALRALLALEPLYASSGAWDKLAGVYEEMGAKLVDPGARIAALRELARLQQVKQLNTIHERAVTYQAILAIDANDETALDALEEIGRATHDDRILVDVYRRLAGITDDPSLAASFLTDLGGALERLGDHKFALDAYQQAVTKDPSVLTAIRGLARVADLLNNARAMANAARLEAELTRKPEIAAKLFVRSGILRREQMNDLGAVEDFERALDVWPDDRDAAERVLQPLLETGQVVRLIDILSKAATSAKSAERKTSLWLEVGNLYTRRADAPGADITAYRRALDATPGHVGTLSKLAEAFQRDAHWGDAVATLEQLLSLSSDESARAQAHLELAGIFDEHLHNIERASRCVEAVLRHAPNHRGALLRLADIQLRSGNEAEAVKTTQRLVELAEGPQQKGAALVRVARIQRSRGEIAAADAAFGEALALEGPGGDAERELKKGIESHGNWAGYAAGLANHIKRAANDRDPDAKQRVGTAFLELATTYADGMKMPQRAIEALVDGLDVTGGDRRLVLALARKLTEAGRVDEALNRLVKAVSDDPLDADGWRELAAAYERGGRTADVGRAKSALVLIGDAARPAKSMARAPSYAEGGFDGSVLAAASVDAATTTPMASLLGSIAETIGKLYTPSLEQYGLTQRDRLGPKSSSPLWELATQIGKMFGAEFELYEHGAPEPTVFVEPFETPALIVSQIVRRLPPAQQAFILAYRLAPIAARLHPALSLRAQELAVALAGAVRIVAPSYKLPGADEGEADDARELLRKHVARRWRKAMETAAAEVAASPPVDIARWQASVNHTSIRAALLVSDDLVSGVEALRLVLDLPNAKGAALVQSSELVRDLMRFWVSPRATQIRDRAGIRPA